MAYQKSAKDLAFDRERARLRHQIKELREDIRKYIIEIQAKEAIIEYDARLLQEAEKKIEELKKLLNIPADQLQDHLRIVKEADEKTEKCKNAVEAMLSIGGYINGI